MHSLPSLLMTLVLAWSAPAAAITFSEPPDLSNSVATPTPITLDPGANTVSGSVATPADRQDNFTITVPAGEMLTAVNLTLDTSGGFVGSVTFNLSEVRTSSGAFAMGLPFGPGTYFVQVITDFSVGNGWQMDFMVTGGAVPVCGNGAVEGDEACDDGNRMSCDGCSDICTVDTDGCLIDDICFAEGAASPVDGCLVCRREVSRFGFSPADAGTACDDFAFCTMADACDGSGLCMGTPMTCDDGDACTTDSCDEGTDACVNEAIPECMPDAGTPDAGMPGDDAGMPGEDGGTTPDAGADSGAASDDAGAGADDAGRRDAGVTVPVDEDDGCGCSAGHRSPVFTGMLLIGVALLIERRRRAR